MYQLYYGGEQKSYIGTETFDKNNVPSSPVSIYL